MNGDLTASRYCLLSLDNKESYLTRVHNRVLRSRHPAYFFLLIRPPALVYVEIPIPTKF